MLSRRQCMPSRMGGVVEVMILSSDTHSPVLGQGRLQGGIMRNGGIHFGQYHTDGDQYKGSNDNDADFTPG